MKIVVISDSHGNIANLKHVMGFAKRINAGAVVHCGDWNNIESVGTVLSFEIPIYSVLGNADINPEIEKLLSKECKKIDRVFLEFELDRKKIGAVHRIQDATLNNQDIIFYGHTHKQLDLIKDDIRMINPGALENAISFVVYDTQINKVEFING